MALIKCKECGKKYSDKAKSCPKCGCPTDLNVEKTFIDKTIDNIVAKQTKVFGIPLTKNIIILGSAALFMGFMFLMLLFLPLDDEGLDTNQVRIDFTSKDLKGDNYESVIQYLSNKGFTNIDVVVIDDLILGWLTEDGEVEKVEINGNSDYTTGTLYSKDSYIVVFFHTFPIEENESIINENTNENPNNLTTENNEDLLLLLTSNDYDVFANFSEKYRNQIIEFDGNICYMDYNEDYKTRYDFMICGGDYDENVQIGPSFKFEDKNIAEFNLIGENIPDYIGIGDNFHFVAKVLEFVENTGIFYLDPISSELR